MSRSEQLHDASMEEILASIRKIITDDEPDTPSGDTFSAAAIDDFREASATLARGRPAGGYMHDLTRALAGEQPAPAVDDDIFDDDAPEPARPAARGERPDALRQEAFTQPAADDDADLFEAEPEAVIERAPEPVLAAVEEDEEIIEDLGEPITLGPEIELVEAAADAPLAVVPAIVETVAVTGPDKGEVTTNEAVTAAADVIEAVAAEPVPETPAAAAAVPPPPPPPPVVSMMTEEVAAPVAQAVYEAVASVTDEVAETVTAMAAGDGLDAAALAPAPAPDVTAEAVAAPVAEAIEKSDPPLVETIAQSVAEAAAEASPETIVPSLEVSAAALVEELSASVSEPSPAATPEADMADAGAEPAPVEGASTGVVPSPPAEAPSLVPDDMMAAMLKPMLKEWLDANMPRIVAKAMGEKDGAGS